MNKSKPKSHRDANRKKAEDFAIEERRLRIVELLREKKSYREMMGELGVAIGTIKADVDAVFAELLETRTINTEDHVLSEMSNLIWTINEAKEQWEASKGRKITEVKYSNDKIGQDGKPIQGVVPDEIKVKTHFPERQYLETIIKAGERMAKLLGADAPQKHEVDAKVTTADKKEIVYISKSIKDMKPQDRKRLYELIDGKNGNGISE